MKWFRRGSERLLGKLEYQFRSETSRLKFLRFSLACYNVWRRDAHYAPMQFFVHFVYILTEHFKTPIITQFKPTTPNNILIWEVTASYLFLAIWSTFFYFVMEKFKGRNKNKLPIHPEKPANNLLGLRDTSLIHKSDHPPLRQKWFIRNTVTAWNITPLLGRLILLSNQAVHLITL